MDIGRSLGLEQMVLVEVEELLVVQCVVCTNAMDNTVLVYP